jgi:hypothetical protein
VGGAAVEKGEGLKGQSQQMLNFILGYIKYI